MMDFILEAWVSGIIERARSRWMLGSGNLAARRKAETVVCRIQRHAQHGSDVRVEEMLRQIRHILGADNVEFSVMTQNFEFSAKVL